MCFIESWFCVPLSHVFKRSALRHLDKNKLSGTISAQISALVELNTLYAPVPFVECWSRNFSNLILMRVDIYRDLLDNSLDGPIPATISKLAKLTFLCVHM